MPALPRPDLPAGPHREFVDALHDLHHRAGWPSLRRLAQAAACSHTTVSAVFSSTRLPAWGLVELLTEAMDGDVEELRRLWLAVGQPSATVAPSIAGRRAELAAVRRHLESGTGLLLVTGEAGIGKTSMLTAAAGSAREVTVAAGHCLPLSAEVPMLPVVELLAELWRADDGARVRGALARSPDHIANGLGSLLPQLAPPPDPAVGGSQLIFAVETLIAALHEADPLALVVEDLHWADSATLDLLEHLAAGTQERFPVVATYRTEDPSTAPAVEAWRARVRRGRRVTYLDLGPLSLDETREQIGLVSDAPPTAALVRRIHDRTRGHPLFTERLAVGDDPSSPGLLSDLLDSATDQLTGAARSVAAALAVVDRPVAEETLADIAHLESRELVRALLDLRSRFLLATGSGPDVALRHPLLGEAIRRRLTALEAADLHRRAAGALAGLCAPAETAEHWLRGGDDELALVYTVRAARSADERVAAPEAADLWLRALDLWGDRDTPVDEPPVTWIQAATAAVAASQLAGRGDAANRVARLALAELDRCSACEAAELLRLAAANPSYDADGEREQLALVERSIEVYDTLPPGEGLVHALDLQAIIFQSMGQYAEAARALRRAVEVLAGFGPSPLERGLQASLAWQEAMSGELSGALRRVAGAARATLAVPEPRRDLYVALCHTDILLMAGRPAGEVAGAAQPSLDSAARLGIRDGHAWLTRANVALALLRAGDPAAAALRLDAETAEEATPETWDLHLVRAQVDVALGQLAAARVRLHQLAELAWTTGLPEPACSLVLVDVWGGRHPAALESALAALDAQAPMPGLTSGWLLACARAAADGRLEMRPQLERLARAQEVVWNRLPIDGAGRGQWEAELARLAGQDTVQLWVRAAAAWDAMARPHDAAYCRWRGAQVALAGGHATHARRLLRQAARDARQHVPLTAAIAETSAYAPAP